VERDGEQEAYGVNEVSGGIGLYSFLDRAKTEIVIAGNFGKALLVI